MEEGVCFRSFDFTKAFDAVQISKSGKCDVCQLTTGCIKDVILIELNTKNSQSRVVGESMVKWQNKY